VPDDEYDTHIVAIREFVDYDNIGSEPYCDVFFTRANSMWRVWFRINERIEIREIFPGLLGALAFAVDTLNDHYRSKTK
jgi:hypothetical protein